MRFFVGLLLFFLACGSLSAELGELQVIVKSEVSANSAIQFRAMKIEEFSDSRYRLPSKEDFFKAASEPSGVELDNRNGTTIELEAGAYVVFAFEDSDGNEKWDPSVPEAIGWYAEQPSGSFGIVRVNVDSTSSVEIEMKAPTHFPSAEQRTEGGVLKRVKGYPVLELKGDAATRGYAHGKLVAPQIVDFFRFYILEAKFRSASDYEEGFAKFLHSHFNYPDEFETECRAVIEGMRASGAELFVPELGRDFSLTDLYAINGYIETRAMRSSCTQFAAWGSQTKGTDVDGGMITARNMDGEIDIRRVTVSHFLLMAVDTEVEGEKRFVSMMWPGFVATISGMNEEGFYTMENAGLTGPGPVVDELVPFSWTMRESLARLGADATPASIQALVDSFDNSVGGACGPGCVTLFAVPYRGQDQPALILEGDRFGDEMRFAEDVAPKIPQFLVASNHHRVYGVERSEPVEVFGKVPSFSSRWRYEAGMHKAAAWNRIGKRVGTKEMQELLQTVAHGTTEYAVITRPNQSEFDVAVASMEAELWDAPYRDWTTFRFEELFSLRKVADSLTK